MEADREVSGSKSVKTAQAELLSSISVVFGLQVLSALGGVVSIRLLTEFLSPDLFGQYKLGLSIVGLMTGLAYRPLLQFAMRKFSDYMHDERGARFVAEFFTIIVLLSLVVTASVLIGNYIFRVYEAWLVSTVLVLLITVVYLDYLRSIFIIRSWHALASLIMVWQKWIPALSICGFIIISPVNSNYALFIHALSLIALTIFLLRYFPGFRWPRLAYSSNNELVDYSNMKNYAWPLAAIGLFSWILNESDRLILNYYHSPAVVGEYASAYGLIASPFIMAAGAIAQLAYPYIFRDSANHHRLVVSFRRLLAVNIVIASLGVMCVIILADFVAYVGLAESYRKAAVDLFWIIAVAYGLYIVATGCDLLAYGVSKTKTMFYAYLLAAMANLAANLWLVPSMKAEGAAIATVIGMFLYTFVMILAAIKWTRGVSD